MPVKSFSKWNGEDGILKYIESRTGCNPFSGSGINIRRDNKTAILKSVDNTYFYDDNLICEYNVQYTLFGHNGNQDINETKFNKSLLDATKIEHIYLYRFIPGKKIKEYIWYGKYEILSSFEQIHVGKDRLPRNIIILNLKKLSD
jgi:hypothetical protein